jgi:transposase
VLRGATSYLLHDNDKKFKSGVVTEWLFRNGVTPLIFPPYSPDLNPIENLWAILARRVEKYQCETNEILQERVVREWEEMDKSKDVLLKLAHSMPARCKAVTDAKGWHTKY